MWKRIIETEFSRWTLPFVMLLFKRSSLAMLVRISSSKMFGETIYFVNVFILLENLLFSFSLFNDQFNRVRYPFADSLGTNSIFDVSVQFYKMVNIFNERCVNWERFSEVQEFLFEEFCLLDQSKQILISLILMNCENRSNL